MQCSCVVVDILLPHIYIYIYVVVDTLSPHIYIYIYVCVCVSGYYSHTIHLYRGGHCPCTYALYIYIYMLYLIALKFRRE